MIKTRVMHLMLQRKELIDQLETQDPGIPCEEIILFGSAARDTMTTHSDIDLAFIVENFQDLETRHQISQWVFRKSQELDIEIDIYLMERKSYETSEMKIYKNIREEGISLWKHIGV